jgi:hypothetical protein
MASPQSVISSVGTKFDGGAQRLVFIEFAGQGHFVGCIARGHFADTADGDDNIVVVGLPQRINQIHFWNLLEQLAFGVRAGLVET